MTFIPVVSLPEEAEASAKKSPLSPIFPRQADSWASAQYECEKLGAFLAEPQTEDHLNAAR